MVSSFAVQPSCWIRDDSVGQMQGYFREIVIQNAMFICEKPEQFFCENKLNIHDFEARYNTSRVLYAYSDHHLPI